MRSSDALSINLNDDLSANESLNATGKKEKAMQLSSRIKIGFEAQKQLSKKH